MKNTIIVAFAFNFLLLIRAFYVLIEQLQREQLVIWKVTAASIGACVFLLFTVIAFIKLRQLPTPTMP